MVIEEEEEKKAEVNIYIYIMSDYLVITWISYLRSNFKDKK